MFDITILAVGKIKERFFQEAFNEYLQRLTPYARIKIQELDPEPFKRNSDKQKAKKNEAERIARYLNKHPDAKVVILDENGRQLNSDDFSNFLNKQTQPIIFVVGGTLGFTSELKNTLKDKLSLSPLTFPHELARVVLAEQLYRAITIIKGKDYHY